MAFLDKVKEAGAKAADKAKDLAENGEAKAKIVLAENKMKDVFVEIGKAVVEAGGVIPEGGIAELLEKVAGFKAEIAQLQAVIDGNKENKAE